MSAGASTPSRRRPSPYGVALVAAVTVQPFIAFAGRNRTQITQTGRVLLYAAAATVLAIGLLAVVVWRWGRPDRNRVAVVVAVVVWSFLNYSALFDPNPADTAKVVGVIAFWSALTAGGARLAYLAAASDNLRFAALVFALMMVLLSASTFVTGAADDGSDVPITDPGELEQPASRPSVYWLLLDAYARPDVLERVVGFDARPFVDELEDRGFQVSSSSLTSYPRTHLSVSSTLQMDYVLEPGHDVTDDFGRFAPVVLGRSNTTARFDALGYQTVYGPAGGLEWSACRPELVDVCLEPNRPSPATGELEQALLDLTPLGVVNLPVPYADPVSFADQLVDVERGVEEPFFVLQHIMTPHDPYRYRDDCTPQAVPTNRRSLTGPEQVDAYATQVRCLNELLLEAFDEIIDRDPSAVIIVQSDHGSDFTFSWRADPSEWGPSQLEERYGAFNAMRLPEGCPVDIEGEPLVNTFRIVFACIEGTEPDLLRYRGFLQPLDDIAALTEIDPDLLDAE